MEQGCQGTRPTSRSSTMTRAPKLNHVTLGYCPKLQVRAKLVFALRGTAFPWQSQGSPLHSAPMSYLPIYRPNRISQHIDPQTNIRCVCVFGEVVATAANTRDKQHGCWYMSSQHHGVMAGATGHT